MRLPATSGTTRAASSPRRSAGGPTRVVLLDEVEKAHPEVFDILLQVLDDGRLTDGQGRTVDFRNTLLILTSNLGSTYLVDPTLDAGEEARVGAGGRARRRSSRSSSTGSTRSWSSTRSPATSWPASSTCSSRCWSSGWRSAGSRSQVTDAARAWLAETGYDPAYGARPLRRLIQRAIGDPLAGAARRRGARRSVGRRRPTADAARSLEPSDVAAEDGDSHAVPLTPVVGMTGRRQLGGAATSRPWTMRSRADSPQPADCSRSSTAAAPERAPASWRGRPGQHRTAAGTLVRCSSSSAASRAAVRGRRRSRWPAWLIVGGSVVVVLMALRPGRRAALARDPGGGRGSTSSKPPGDALGLGVQGVLTLLPGRPDGRGGLRARRPRSSAGRSLQPLAGAPGSRSIAARRAAVRQPALLARWPGPALRRWSPPPS